jgi:hypothetical protein
LNLNLSFFHECIINYFECKRNLVLIEYCNARLAYITTNSSPAEIYLEGIHMGERVCCIGEKLKFKNKEVLFVKD